MRALAFSALLLTAGCANFPEVAAVEGPDIDAAPAPRLVPAERLLASSEPQLDPEQAEWLLNRAAALQRRADRLAAEGALTPESRAQMEAGVAQP